jgi:hypothetical protein
MRSSQFMAASGLISLPLNVLRDSNQTRINFIRVNIPAHRNLRQIRLSISAITPAPTSATREPFQLHKLNRTLLTHDPLDIAFTIALEKKESANKINSACSFMPYKSKIKKAERQKLHYQKNG